MCDTLIDDTCALVPPPRSRRVLGLAGPPAAGKSHLARRLVAGVNERMGEAVAAYVPLDGFHLSNAQLARLGYLDRKGAPFTFDVAGYVALLRRLISDTEAVYVPDYDRELHEPIAARHVVEPAVRLVVTEGNYLASGEPGWRDIADVVSPLWYVDAPETVREARLVERHSSHGRDAEAARRRMESNDRPNAAFVTDTRHACDRVIGSG